MNNLLNFKLLLIPFTFFLFSCHSQKLNLKIMEINPYCGGARPTPEMEADAQTPKPYAGKYIYYRTVTGKVDSAKTDENGILIVKLKTGSYYFDEGWKILKKTPNGMPEDQFNTDCLKRHWEMFKIEVNVNGKTINVIKNDPIIIPCDYQLPCLKDKFLPPMRE